MVNIRKTSLVLTSVPPQVRHPEEMVYQWYTIGIPMVYQKQKWYTNGIPTTQMVYQWYTIGILMVYQGQKWYTNGIPIT